MEPESAQQPGRRHRRIRVTLSAWTVGLMLFALAAGVVKLTIVMREAAAQELGPGPTVQASQPPPAEAVAETAPTPQATAVASAADLQADEFSVHIPDGAHLPLTTLVTLHGMGGSGQAEAGGVIQQQADAMGWAVVAPTFGYGNWQDPNQLRSEDPANVARIADFLDRLPDVVGYSVDRQVLLYGFSRGSQTANRFALAYPKRVAGAALASAGTYTLPVASIDGDSGSRALPFPYGVGDFPDLFGHPFDAPDFAQIPFWIGVGAQDVDPSDVPHQWDPYIGSQRVQRAEEFASWLRSAGADVEVDVFPSVAHGETPDTRASAMHFLATHRHSQ